MTSLENRCSRKRLAVLGNAAKLPLGVKCTSFAPLPPFLGSFSFLLGAQEQMRRNSVVFSACGIQNEKRQKNCFCGVKPINLYINKLQLEDLRTIKHLWTVPSEAHVAADVHRVFCLRGSRLESWFLL